MANELERLEKTYKQLLSMGFTSEEIEKFLTGKKGPVKELSQKEAIDTMVLYFRAKKLVEDSHVQGIIRNNEHLRGTSSISNDVNALMAYQSFVETIEKTLVLKNVGGQESIRTWENYFKEKEDAYRKRIKNSGKVSKREIARYEDIRKNPYDPRIKDYLDACMDDQTKSDVAYAMNNDPVALSTIRGFALEAGKAKQESYVDTVLKYLYADTTVSKMRAKEVQQEAQIKNLQAKLANAQTLMDTERAVLAAVAGFSTEVQNAINVSNADIKADIAKLSGKMDDLGAGQMTLAGIVNNRADELVDGQINLAGTVNQRADELNEGQMALAGIVNNRADELVDGQEQILGKLNKKAPIIGKLVSGVLGAALIGSLVFNVALGSKLGIVNDKLANAESENVEMQGQLNTITENNLILQATINVLRNEISGLNGQIAELKEGREADAQTILDLQESLLEKTADIARLEEALKASDNAEEVLKLQDDLKAAKANLEKAQTELADLAVEKGVLETENATLKASIDDLNKEINELTAAGTVDKATIEELRAEIDDKAAEIARLQAIVDSSTPNADVEAVRAELEAAKAELETAQTRISELEKANSDLTDENDSLNTENVDLKQEVASLLLQVESLSEAGVVDKATIDELSAQLTEKLQIIEELEALIAQSPSSEEFENIKAEIEEYKVQLEAAQAVIEQKEAEIESLESENSNLREEVEDLTESLEAATQVTEQLRNDIAGLQASNEQYVQQIAEFGLQVEELNANYNEKVAEYNELFAQYNELLENGASAEEIAELQSQISTLEANIEEYEKALDAVEGELAAVVAENQNNAEFLDELYYALQGASSGRLTDAQIREIIADMLDVNYSENTQGSENDLPQRG